MSSTAAIDMSAIDKQVDIVETPRMVSDWYLTDTHQEKLSFSAVAPVDVQIRRLSVEVHTGRRGWFAKNQNLDEEKGVSKGLLSQIDADFPHASLTGIIGSSGSGKTTLLNVLSRRMHASNLAVHGHILYNNSPSISDITHAYVTQTDILLPTLTVRETLMYAADLRLPASITSVKRAQLVEEIILELGLKECADTPVGDGFRRKGCSGGERRRVSLGVQLLGNPSVLFLDEPTTGLDATSAFQLVKTLQSMAKKGRTIIMTLHQPRSEIFFMLDRVTLLAQGHTLYTGPISDAVPWFEGHLNPIDHHVNPANYLIDAAAIDVRTTETEEAARARVNRLISAWHEESVKRYPEGLAKQETESTTTLIPRSAVPDHNKVPVSRTVFTLLSRTLKTSYRDPLGMTTSWIEAVLMGVVVGLVFLQLPDSIAGIRSRQAALYTAVGLQGYLIVMYEVYRLTVVEMPVFDREHGEGIVGVLPWILSYRIAHLLLEDIIVPLVFCAISYFMIGFAPSASRFFFYFAIGLLNHFTSVSFAGLSSAISRNFATATLVANLAFTAYTFACGFFIQGNSIPIYLRWIKWISQLFYAFTALVNNEFKGRFFDCPSGDARTDPNCITYRGDFIIESLAVPRKDWTTIPVVAMLGFAILYLIFQILLLFVIKINITVLGTKRTADEPKQKNIKVISRAANAVAGVDIDLIDYTLHIRTRGGKSRTVLQGINTCFEAGKVNVILGPSGSGKSSLLNLMAQRLQSTLRTTYVAEGDLALNGVVANGDVVRVLCSYVMQDDAALLPYLTVRETLRFAAGLRLPSWMSKEEKRQKADEVMHKMGLKDCADTLVGTELSKGISGGEKRRVSIAIQVLTEPQVLMLDEPTSGLDVFTAASIMDVLRQLAEEGRTIITTLHQSSSELFRHFGNVLLLTKGGRVAYSGPACDMLEYMASVGFKCPSTMNPADFALDVVSVDLREAEQEELSRVKVDRLVEEFRKQTHKVEDRKKTSGLSLDLKKYEKKMSPLTTSLPILLKRGYLAFIHQKTVPEARFGNVLGLGVVSSLFFSPIGHNYISIQNRVGCIQEILPLYFVGMLQNIAVYPVERDIFYREYDDGAYSIESFFIAYVLLELPCEVLSCLIFSALTAIATDLRRTVSMFLVVSLNALCIVNAGESLGILFNTLLNENTGLALNVTNVILSVAMFMAGLMSLDMPAFLKGLNKLSPLGYAIRNIMPYAFRGQVFSCDDDQRLVDGTCAVSSGEQVLDMFELGGIDAQLNLGAIVVAMVLYRLLAYVVLKLVKARFKVERRRKSRA
ncbi:P-loop containing nucleoside triphosphate hydrolase protein [Desarmillaria tabescens]|uniref:P-loop containing nucleoside triphosphate hydrolase protein n=1 Tax=Armillaria tabescens TaxID=1929756 RepID=A0AA39TPN9_ARMTA|nr:P-loop containing nucleoside triphosphate hydrolase protein [Desarmillaria tabescens]KAK0462088.1 P-loop containing nucleoside triphosphate hydrolase protein [Desarmillaria tabescens]